MRHVKPGTYSRHTMPGALRRFSPAESLARLEDVDLAGLRASGKRLILLDVDNTLIPWRTEEVPESTHRWIEQAHALGFELCAVSNTSKPERLARLCEAMGIGHVRDKNKPSRRMYLLAMERHRATPEETVMIGDQLLTDVLGANRAGIDAIWVRPIGKNEFLGTRLISRPIERVMARLLHRYFQAAPTEGPVPSRPGLYSRETLAQFGKFAVVGIGSTLIDAGLMFLLMFFVPWGGKPLGQALGEWALAAYPDLFRFAAARPSDAAVPILKVPATAAAILNGFYWNRRWTFEARDHALRSRQFWRYFVVAVAAMVVNAAVTTVCNNIVPGHPKQSLLVALVISTVVAGVFNFYFQRKWTFAPPE
jgi:HAD superfamily phosphatase (TIGR01668 family)